MTRNPLTFLFLLLGISFTSALSQVETVPVGHPVYQFLKHMEVKGALQEYHDAVLPLSRSRVAQHLVALDKVREGFSRAEKGMLDDFLAEFRFDLTGSLQNVYAIVGGDTSLPENVFGGEFSDREKFMYASHDSLASIFLTGLLEVNNRTISGDALGSQHATFFQGGVRLRGTLLGHLGFSMQATNAQFWGSRELLQRDPHIAQSYGLTTADAQNFDFSEGYARFETSVVSAQIGQERILWGTGSDQQMIISDNARTFPFVRFDISYKSFRYTFLHGWLLGSGSFLKFSLPFDTSATFVEPLFADKYIAAHRFEFSFPGALDIGFTESYIYSNRSPDLAYFNPFVLLESAQRNRGERDNGSWAFDVKTRFLRGVEWYGTWFYDDIHFGELFSAKWYDRYAFQAGVMVADLPGIPGTTLTAEYTHIEPYLYAHNRSRDDSFTSAGALLGPRIGPNADSWFFRLDYIALRNLVLALSVTSYRKGNNDFSGTNSRNVGADPLIPHRSSDSETKVFLDGLRDQMTHASLRVTYEALNQLWLEGEVHYEKLRQVSLGGANTNTTIIAHVRMEI